MTDSHDDKSLLPSPLDEERCKAIHPNGDVTAENGTWRLSHFDAAHLTEDQKWCPFTLNVNHEALSESHNSKIFEFKAVEEAFRFLEKLENIRTKGKS
jgi:hypothetical protein